MDRTSRRPGLAPLRAQMSTISMEASTQTTSLRRPRKSPSLVSAFREAANLRCAAPMEAALAGAAPQTPARKEATQARLAPKPLKKLLVPLPSAIVQVLTRAKERPRVRPRVPPKVPPRVPPKERPRVPPKERPRVPPKEPQRVTMKEQQRAPTKAPTRKPRNLVQQLETPEAELDNQTPLTKASTTRLLASTRPSGASKKERTTRARTPRRPC